MTHFLDSLSTLQLMFLVTTAVGLGAWIGITAHLVSLALKRRQYRKTGRYKL